MANLFYTGGGIGQGLGQGLAAIGQGVERGLGRKYAQEEQLRREALAQQQLEEQRAYDKELEAAERARVSEIADQFNQAFESGDQEQLAKLSVQYPQQANAFVASRGVAEKIANNTTANQIVDILSATDTQEEIRLLIEAAEAAGKDPQKLIDQLEHAQRDPEGYITGLQAELAPLNPAAWKVFNDKLKAQEASDQALKLAREQAAAEEPEKSQKQLERDLFGAMGEKRANDTLQDAFELQQVNDQLNRSINMLLDLQEMGGGIKGVGPRAALAGWVEQVTGTDENTARQMAEQIQGGNIDIALTLAKPLKPVSEKQFTEILNSLKGNNIAGAISSLQNTRLNNQASFNTKRKLLTANKAGIADQIPEKIDFQRQKGLFEKEREEIGIMPTEPAAQPGEATPPQPADRRAGSMGATMSRAMNQAMRTAQDFRSSSSEDLRSLIMGQ